nr:hypothetical protein CFP56_07119 [Quercus suber]
MLKSKSKSSVVTVHNTYPYMGYLLPSPKMAPPQPPLALLAQPPSPPSHLGAPDEALEDLVEVEVEVLGAPDEEVKVLGAPDEALEDLVEVEVEVEVLGAPDEEVEVLGAPDEALEDLVEVEAVGHQDSQDEGMGNEIGPEMADRVEANLVVIVPIVVLTVGHTHEPHEPGPLVCGPLQTPKTESSPVFHGPPPNEVAFERRLNPKHPPIF